MRKNWKRWASVLGGAMLLCSPFEAVPARAAEDQTQVVVEGQQQAAVQAATDVHWSETGQAVYTNPNAEDCVMTIVLTTPGGSYEVNVSGALPGGETCILDLYHNMNQPGDYTFKVILSANGTSAESASSEAFTYTVPDAKLPAPIVKSVTRDGIITLSLPEADKENYTIGTDYGFAYQLLCNGTPTGYTTGQNESIVDVSSRMEPGKVYSIQVCTLSRNINKYRDSDWSAPIPINPSEQQSDAGDSGQSEPWVPTPEELKLYEACGTEEVVYTENADNAYNVTIMNSIQGFLCWNSFDSVRGNYTIARTYNIYPTYSGMIYKMDSKAKITLTIPESLRAKNRSFRMIVVTEDGKATVLKDLDSDPNTITFETDTYYAFALVYRDKAVSKK